MNFAPFTHHYRKFQRFYHQLPHARIISTGWHIAAQLQQLGIDAVYVGKSYHDAFLVNLDRERDIDFGFIGTTQNSVYKKRNEMLKAFQQKIDLQVMTTDSKQAYLETLNRIKVFVSADIGMQEYMAKSFEAMGCGCALLAYRQGGEEQYLGFKHLHNVILYSTAEEAVATLAELQKMPGALEKIARNGYELAKRRFITVERDKKLFETVEKPFENRQKLPLIARLKQDWL